MGIIIRFPGRRRHARASLGSGAAISAKASNVISEQPLSPANRTISAQRRGGMPRARQELIVFSGKPSAPATAPVPPRASIAESAESDMDPNIVRNLRTCQEFAACEATFGEGNAEISPMAESVKDIAKRLIATREALGYAQADFCREIKVEKNVYNPFEKGRRRITVDVAIKIRRRFAIPLDWTYCADPAELPGKIVGKLAPLAA